MPTAVTYSLPKAAADLAAALVRSRVQVHHGDRFAAHPRAFVALDGWYPLDLLILPGALQQALGRPATLDARLLPHRGPAAPLLRQLIAHEASVPGAATRLDAVRVATAAQAVVAAVDLEQKRRALREGAGRAEEAPVVVPLSVTYHGPAARHNLFARLATRAARGALSPRAIDDALLAGTVLDPEASVSVTVGRPILVHEYFDVAEADGPVDVDDLRQRLVRRARDEAAGLRTLDFRHLLALLLAEMPPRRFTPWQLRMMAYRLARTLVQRKGVYLHREVRERYGELLFGDLPTPVDEMIAAAQEEGLLIAAGEHFRRRPADLAAAPRERNSVEVRCAETDGRPEVRRAARWFAHLPHRWNARCVRRDLLRDDIECFESDYARNYHEELSKGPDVGRPFLLRPYRARAAVVLAHGYMAAPLEIRALANYLRRRGYIVYGTRFRGHGTSPEDLARTPWNAWYEGYNRGYAIARTLHRDVFLAGFSTGGCIALLAAAHKGDAIRGVIPMCAPIRLLNTTVRLVPSVVAINALLKRFAWSGWEYISHEPENKHINYTQNPLTGMRELMELMQLVERRLPEVRVPVLAVQASKDPTVDRASAGVICEKAGAAYRELAMFEAERHGIVNGPGSSAVFQRVAGFLDLVLAGAAESFQRATPTSAASPEQNLAVAAAEAGAIAAERERSAV